MPNHSSSNLRNARANKNTGNCNRRRRTSKRASKYNRQFSIDVDALAEELFACEGDRLDGSADAFKWDYLRKELLSKLPRPGFTAEDRKEAAIMKMFESEKTCAEINRDGFKHSDRVDLDTVLFYARRIVSNVLGCVNYRMFEKAVFSSGASTSRRREHGHPYFKYCSRDGRLDVTPKAEKYAAALISLTPLWASTGAWCSLNIIAGNSVTTVPKKTEIDRTIAKEPDMNMCLQKAVGTYIRSKLKHYGIDLNDQARNASLARLGSISRQLATIDLSAASDSISDRLVWDLLPPDWYALLDDLRSHYGLLPGGRLFRWSKFSSMGNGFTFELESLLFFALVRGTEEAQRLSSGENHGTLHGLVGVYGDDIICHTDIADDVIETLRCVGFATNKDKTFTTGPFRESCGSHYFNGVDVAPFYIRKPIDSIPRVMWFLNSLRAWAAQHSDGISDPRVYDLWLRLRRKYVPSTLLGGKDTNDITSCVSPHQPRKKLVEKTKARPIGGVKAILSLWQTDASWQTFRYVDPLERLGKDEQLRRLDQRFHRGQLRPDLLHPNLVTPLGLLVLKKNEQWPLSVPTFPQELVEIDTSLA